MWCRVRCRIDHLIDDLEAAMVLAGPGPRCVDLPVRWRTRAATRALEVIEGSGFEVVAPRQLLASGKHRGAEVGSTQAVSDVAGSRPHRHQVLCVTSERGAYAAARLVKTLARVSPRGHLVIVTADVPTRRVQRRQAGHQATSDADAARLAQLIAAGEFERAEAWCAAVLLAADLCRGLEPESVVVQAVRLCLRQSRYEEAGRLAGRAGAACERRRLGRWVASVCAGGGLARQARAGPPPGASVVVGAWRYQVRRARPEDPSPSTRSHGASMFLFPAVPALLQSLAEADDELVALRAAVAWALRHAAASGVACVGGAEAVVLASAGQPLGVAERLPAMAVCDAACAERGPLVVCTAAVRYAGAHVGAVVVSGPAERRGTCLEAATMLAALCAPAVRTRLDALAAHRQGRERLADIIGDSPATAALRDEIARAAVTPFAVLVEGESGTGKELVARALHRLSARRDRRCVAVNCAALSDDLIEAELFGHSRGAFTGAVGPRTGLFEDAHGGTLFLDEVAELSPRAQAKLLRVLQEREVRRVGENAPRAIDVRVVAATNRPLADAVAAGQFRHDLLFRLAVVRIRLVPLRDRAEDIAPIASACWLRTMRDLDKRAVLGVDALARLATHTWPGNVRELQNVVAGLAVVAPTRGRVSARHVDHVLASAGVGPRVPPMSLEHARQLCDRQTVAAALARHAGRRSRAARELGLTRQGLTKLLRRLHIHDSPIEGVA